MNESCDFCKNEIKSTIEYRWWTGGLHDIVSKFHSSAPFICNYCGGSFCDTHRLPENHNCTALENWGHWGAYIYPDGRHQIPSYDAKIYSETVKSKPKVEYSRPIPYQIPPKQPIDKESSVRVDEWKEFVINLTLLIMLSMWLIVLPISFQHELKDLKLNETTVWLIPLLVILGILWIKYLYKLFKQNNKSKKIIRHYSWKYPFKKIYYSNPSGIKTGIMLLICSFIIGSAFISLLLKFYILAVVFAIVLIFILGLFLLNDDA